MRVAFAMADRDSILADFQACTGNENFEECIAILEQHDWDLHVAVQAAMHGGFLPPPSPPPAQVPYPFEVPDYPNPSESHLRSHSPEPNIPDLEELLPPEPVNNNRGGDCAESAPSVSTVRLPCIPSTSSAFSPMKKGNRMLQFEIEYNERTLSLEVPEYESVRKLKELIEAEFHVPVARQNLRGWVTKHDKTVSDLDLLCELRLPRETTLFLLTHDLVVSDDDSAETNGEAKNELIKRLGQTFTLHVKFRDKDKVYSLNFPGAKTVKEVKQDVHAIIDVPVRRQRWTGWPPGVQDDDTMTLAGSEIDYPAHYLEVTSAPSPPRPLQRTSPLRAASPGDAVSEESDSDATFEVEISEDEFEDASQDVHDDMFENSASRAQPLMPETAESQMDALESFQREFCSRYGDMHPVFYLGSLDDALKDALQLRAAERKLLAVYLHHDKSILSNVFCSQVFCSESIVTFLSNYFLTWAWDITSDVNKTRFLNMCTQHFGTVAADAIRRFRVDELPILLIISRSRGTNEVIQVIHGNVSIDELLTQLIHAQDSFNHQQQSEIAEEEEREARQRVLAEQNDAYELSLAADRAKAEARRVEEEQERARQAREDLARRTEEQRQRDEQQQKEARRKSLADALPAEPAADCADPVSVIRFRVPQGVAFTRRFLASHTLQVLLNFVSSKGFPASEFKLLTTYPRRDLRDSDAKSTLEELKLFPQETVILEEI